MREFIVFRHAKSTNGVAISDVIVQFLAYASLDIGNVRAQCCHGTTNMSCKYYGVQSNIRELSPAAAYIHCKAHSLNLALVHSSNSNELCIITMMSTVQDIAVCFDFSAKRLIAFSDELAEKT